MFGLIYSAQILKIFQQELCSWKHACFFFFLEKKTTKLHKVLQLCIGHAAINASAKSCIQCAFVNLPFRTCQCSQQCPCFVKSVTCVLCIYFTFLKLVLKPRRLFFQGIKFQTSFFKKTKPKNLKPNSLVKLQES